MQGSNSLLRTKLRPPFTRTELVARPRLQEQLARGLHSPLTLITAPAGFGKTTLVASTIGASGMPVAWLSLDKNDNDVGRFLSYLIAALQEAEPTIGLQVADLVGEAQQVPTEGILTRLVNDLDTIGRELALVLDDYQFLNNQAVHQALTFLLEHCPQTLHLVIATRSDPPLPLARLRARGQTVELRADDLSFNQTEAGQFLNDVMGLDLDAGAVAALAERTEGWAAGLQMAALSMRHHEDMPGFIEGFSGTNRYIMDYLLEEILAVQSPELKRFLLVTSILERLTAPLCDAILSGDGAPGEKDGNQGNSGASPRIHSSASTLAHLERANLFLVPLDDKRVWYRYHHLVADWLQAQLRKTLGAQEVARLHVRAAEWHEKHGSLLEAIHHA